jgi:hypothetical protein
VLTFSTYLAVNDTHGQHYLATYGHTNPGYSRNIVFIARRDF